ncbi:MAG: hypothetical protein KDA81_01090 [Planctomycetaceae bacterium]|nr:hypothetical protein [Planctomycetaceae bacterium]
MKPTCMAILLASSFCAFGCAQSLLNQTRMEQRVVEQFAAALDEENEPALRRITSSRFEQLALQSDDVLTDLRVLHLPTSEVSVVEVNKLDDDRREVIVKEEAGGKYQFVLVKDDSKGYWTVDDVMVRQKNKGTRVTRSTTEVMDLLMTLRQFLGVWESGDREEILAMTSPELAASLEPLPDEWLRSLTRRIASTYEEGMARKPEANLTDVDAVVKLPARNGHLLLRIVRSESGWLVDDVESHNHREDHHPGSVRRQADAINSVNAFLAAYRAENHEQLQHVTSKEFYDASLKVADLSLIELPTASDVPDEFDIRAFEDQLTFMIPSGSEIVRVDLEERSDEGGPTASGETGTSMDHTSPKTRFLIRDVTLYERSTQRQRSLSSVFTAPTHAMVFFKALRERDHKVLSRTSTDDFGRATWNRISPEILQALPIPEFDTDQLKLTDSHTQSQRTELEFQTGSGLLLSCRMATSPDGFLRVEDIQYPNEQGNVTSLRTRLELTIPLTELAMAWKSQDMELLQKSCSADFNRLVWSHLRGIPNQFPGMADHLLDPVRTSRVTQDRATVSLGSSEGNTINASLVMEHGFWVIDEVRTFSSGQPVAVRDTLRSQIAARLLNGSYSTVQTERGEQIVKPYGPGNAENDWPRGFISPESAADKTVMQVSATQDSEQSRRRVNPAVHTRTDEQPSASPVSNAVYTQEFPADQMAESQRRERRSPADSRIQPAGHQVSQDLNPFATGEFSAPTARAGNQAASTSTSGVQVFGPDADRLTESMKSRRTNVNQGESPAGSAIDMTPPEFDRKAFEDPAAEDTFLYFGPTVNPLAEKSLDTQSAPETETIPRRITNPADHPIPIE